MSSKQNTCVVTVPDVRPSADPLFAASLPSLGTDFTEEGPPAVPFPDRSGRSSAIIVPKWIYIKDGQGRYLTVRTKTSGAGTLTFRSGTPDLNCVFEAIPSMPSCFMLKGRNGNSLSRINVGNQGWYNANPVDSQYFITFRFILARESIVYMQDNIYPVRFMSSQLGYIGYPLGLDVINADSEMEISIAAVKNEIIDVVYDINGASVRNAAPLIALSTSVRNDSDADVNQTLSYSYERWSVGTWNNTAGIEIGAKTTFSAGVPLVASAEFEISVSASYEHEWGGEQGTRETITSSTMVAVPSKKKAQATIIVQNAQIDIGFSYTQRVLWSNGQSQDTKLTGIYNNVDSWHVDVVLDNWQDV